MDDAAPRHPFVVPDEFFTRIGPAWRKRPISIPQPFAPLVTPDDVFEGWKACGAAVRAGVRDIPLRLYRGERNVDAAPYVPAPSDTTFDAWLERLQREQGEPEWGFNLSNPQAWSGPIFRRLLTFLDSLYRATGVARGGSVPDLFFMNHARSFFGLHKDAQDVFTFVVSGTRRYLLWPFEAFAAAAGRAPNDSLAPHRLPEVDWSAHRESAVVVEAHAGDVLYWPAEWWHAGESTGRPGLTIAVGVVHFANPIRHVSRAAEAIGSHFARETAPLPYPSGPSADGTVAAELEWTRLIASEPLLVEELRRDVRAWLSKAGLARIPAAGPSGAPFLPSEWVARTSPTAIAWSRGNGSLLCAVGGREIELPLAAEEALARITSRDVHGVGALLAESAPETRAVVADLLAKLEACHGIERIPFHAA